MPKPGTHRSLLLTPYLHRGLVVAPKNQIVLLAPDRFRILSVDFAGASQEKRNRSPASELIAQGIEQQLGGINIAVIEA